MGGHILMLPSLCTDAPSTKKKSTPSPIFYLKEGVAVHRLLVTLKELKKRTLLKYQL